MLILSLRTDKPLAEIGLYNDKEKLGLISYEAHRILAETIHVQIQKLLKKHKLDWDDLGGIVCFKGPGSFTGLRIGLSVANALAYGLGIPIIGTDEDTWLEDGITQLLSNKDQQKVMPVYGAEPHITQPKK